MMIDETTARTAFEARDRAFDGRFVVTVSTTRIYCRPSCAARRPRPENVGFLPDAAAAERAGFRACLRCRPEGVARDEAAVTKAAALIEAADEAPGLADLATAVGYAPHHFHRLFRRATGVTPAAYWRGVRAARADAALERSSTVTEAIYDAGYAAPARFYAEAPDRIGMAPSARARGGVGERIRWTIGETGFGPMLLAATDKGICRLSFGEGEAELRAHYPAAAIERSDDALQPLLDDAIAAVEAPSRPVTLPLDLRGTAFQQAVWAELARIPAGETLSYAALAARAGKPAAVRAVGSACGANPVAVLVPCHRAKRSDGSLGGYAYGLPMKEELLEREASSI